MKKTIICHFYNEEYLLPWWLKHHRQFFDHGIMINYASTDNSVNIIKDLCPSWDIVDSINSSFIDHEINSEVKQIDRTVEGWRICLNVTEFIFGDFSSIENEKSRKNIMMPMICIVDDQENRPSESINSNLPLHEQLKTGLSVEDSIKEYAYRTFANYPQWIWPMGRHFKEGKQFPPFESNYEHPFIILKYMLAPMTEEFIKRKLQIQDKIPYKDQQIWRGGGHHTDYGAGLTKEKILKNYKTYKVVDVSSIIEKYVKLCYNQEH